jgi:NADPH-dependent curcumin reductase CurA
VCPQNAPQALMMLFEGQNTGKLMIEVAERAAKL